MCVRGVCVLAMCIMCVLVLTGQCEVDMSRPVGRIQEIEAGLDALFLGRGALSFRVDALNQRRDALQGAGEAAS